jgi:hypothetical protein
MKLSQYLATAGVALALALPTAVEAEPDPANSPASDTPTIVDTPAAEPKPVSTDTPAPAAPSAPPDTTNPKATKRPPLPDFTPPSPFGDYKLTLSDDKKVVHIMGGFRSGLPGELKQLLASNPTITKAVLSSPGGSMIDGIAVEKIIRKHGLDTHVELLCASACTEAFFGGTKRTVAPTARLGFHQATQGFFGLPIPLGDESDSAPNRLIRKILADRGLSAGFVDKVLATPNRDVWLPDHDQLLAEKIVTQVVKDGRPGIAPLGTWRNAADMERELLTGPLWDYARTHRQKIYYPAALHGWIGNAVSKEKLPPAEQANKSLTSMVLKNADLLPDALLLRFIANEHMIWNKRADATNKGCRSFFRSEFPISVPTDPALLSEREAVLLAMLKAGDGEVVANADRSKSAQASLIDFWAEMVAQGDFDSSKAERNFCVEPLSYYDVLAKLPEAKRPEIYRALVINLLHPVATPEAFKPPSIGISPD